MPASERAVSSRRSRAVHITARARDHYTAKSNVRAEARVLYLLPQNTRLRAHPVPRETESVSGQGKSVEEQREGGTEGKRGGRRQRERRRKIVPAKTLKLLCLQCKTNNNKKPEVKTNATRA
eukprot:3649819-Rhodomonas_salina.1